MKTFLALLIIISLVIFSGCPKNEKPDPELTEQQERAQLLEGTWGNASNVVVPPDVDDNIISGISITFSTSGEIQPDTFSAFGTVKIFDTSANSGWSFSNDINQVLLSNVFPVTSFVIVSITETTIIIQLDHPGGEGFEGKDGTYSVTLTKLSN